jgi:hypothetical protein
LYFVSVGDVVSSSSLTPHLLVAPADALRRC